MENVEKKILSKIGKSVKFKYPEKSRKGKNVFHGKLIDRCIFKTYSWTDIPSWDIVDLIEFEEFTALRFGYYRLKDGKLRWASQTTLTESLEDYRKLFVKAAKEKEWFKKFLQDVLEKVEKT